MAIDAKQIRQWSEELTCLAARPTGDVLAEALDLSRAVEEAMHGSAPEAAPENLMKTAELCLRYLTVRLVPVSEDADEAIRRIVSGKAGRIWSLALIAEYEQELEELLKQQHDASAEADKLHAEATALRRRHDRMKQYAALLDALAGKPPAAQVDARGEDAERKIS
jgi:hypothetical protein